MRIYHGGEGEVSGIIGGEGKEKRTESRLTTVPGVIDFDDRVPYSVDECQAFGNRVCAVLAFYVPFCAEG